MFFLFGISFKDEVVRTLKSIGCNECSGISDASVIKTYQYFYLFFIPLFKFSVRYFVKCNNCEELFEVTKEIGEKLERHESVKIEYSDLKSMKVGKLAMKNGQESDFIKCQSCSRMVEKSYKYCPYCGKKI